MTWIMLIIMLAVAQYLVLTSTVGATRAKYAVEAPKTVGNEDWERRFRVQQNTMEQLVAFVPSLYFCAVYASVPLAIVGGVVWLAGRTHYALSYYNDPKRRAPGMLMTFFSTAVMAVAAIGGIALHLVS